MQEQSKIRYVTRSKVVGINFFGVMERGDAIRRNWEIAGKYVFNKISLTKTETVGHINEMFNINPVNYVKRHCNFIDEIYVFDTEEDMENYIKIKQL